MADVSYVVDCNILVQEAATTRSLGRVGGGVDRLDGAFQRLGREAWTAGGKMAGAFTGAVESAGRVAASAAKVGAGLAIAGAVFGVTKLNAAYESTRVSIAAVLNAQKQVPSIGAGLERASDLIATMRKDARDLPGEFEDLLYIFQTGVGAAGNAGLNAIQFERMAAQAMAAGKAMSVPLDQAGRELALLFEGRAGTHNVFGSRLGIHAKGFNELAPEKRIEVIRNALEAFQPAIKEFGTTFEATSSAFLDNVKLFGQRATLRLFDKIKFTLSDINNWFDQNEGTVTTWADRIGRFLGDAFDVGRQFVLDWWPAISTFAENAYNKLTSIWRDIRPEAEAVGESIRNFLKDEGSIDKIIAVLKLYAGVKVAGGGADMFGGVASAGLGVYNAYKMQQIAAAAAGGGTAAAGGAAATTSLAALGSAAAVAGAALLAVAGVGAAVWQFGGLVDDLNANRAAYLNSQMVAGHRTIADIVALGEAAGVSAEGLIYADRDYQSAIQNLIAAQDELGASVLMAAAAAASAAATFNSIQGARVTQDVGVDALQYVGLMAASGQAGAIAGAAAAADKDPKSKGKGKGGGGGGAAKIEIVINSNQAPGQIARRVVDELRARSKHPRSSVQVRNFGASLRGG